MTAKYWPLDDHQGTIEVVLVRFVQSQCGQIRRFQLEVEVDLFSDYSYKRFFLLKSFYDPLMTFGSPKMTLFAYS